MKLSTKSLKQALADVGRVMKTRTTLPVLSCVKLSVTDDDRLQLECTNMDAFVTRLIDCSGAIDPILVNFKKLVEVCDNSTSESLEIEMVGAMLKVVGNDGKSMTTLKTLPGAEFPANPAGSNAVGLAVPATDLADALDATIWAADREESSRFSTQCVQLEMQPKMLRCFSGTRGMLAALFTRPLIVEAKTLMLPASGLPVLSSALREAKCNPFTNGGWLIARHAQGSCAFKVSEAPTLTYDIYLENRKGLQGTPIDRELLRRACSYALSFEQKLLAAVTIERKDGKITVSCVGDGDSYSESMEAEGEDFKVKVPADHLNSATNKMIAPTAQLMIKESAVFLESGDLLVAIAMRRN